MARLVRFPGWIALLLAGSVAALAADWLSYGGDAQRSGWQRRGKQFTTGNAKELKLLWKRQLDDPLTAPVIIGPTITHRGVRELVFAGGAADNLYAVDADLGTIFWKRHFEASTMGATTPGSGRCGGLTATPVIEPDPDVDPDDDEDADEAGPMRPMYVVASDGRLHRVRVSDGADMTPPSPFPPGAHASALNFWSGVVYTTTSGGCRDVPEGVGRSKLPSLALRLLLIPPSLLLALPEAALRSDATGRWSRHRTTPNGEIMTAIIGAMRLKAGGWLGFAGMGSANAFGRPVNWVRRGLRWWLTAWCLCWRTGLTRLFLSWTPRRERRCIRAKMLSRRPRANPHWPWQTGMSVSGLRTTFSTASVLLWSDNSGER